MRKRRLVPFVTLLIVALLANVALAAAVVTDVVVVGNATATPASVDQGGLTHVTVSFTATNGSVSSAQANNAWVEVPEKYVIGETGGVTATGTKRVYFPPGNYTQSPLILSTTITIEAHANAPTGAHTIALSVNCGSNVNINATIPSIFVDVTGSGLPPADPLKITAPADITFEGNTSGGAQNVPLGAPEVEGGTEPYDISNDAPNFFPLGTTIVTWTVTDADGTVATATQKVTVVDTTPPEILGAPDTWFVTVGASSAPLIALVSAVDIVDPNPVVTHDAPATFGPGEKIVKWTATDASGNFTEKTTVVTATYIVSGDVVITRIVKRGSTIPFKFSVSDVNGVVSDPAVIRSSKIAQLSQDGDLIGEAVELETSAGKSNINGWRYDANDGHFIWTWQSSRSAEPGDYVLVVELVCGTKVKFFFRLGK